MIQKRVEVNFIEVLKLNIFQPHSLWPYQHDDCKCFTVHKGSIQKSQSVFQLNSALADLWI